MNRNFKFPFWNAQIEQVVDDFIKSLQNEDTKDFGWSWTRPMANIEENDHQYLIFLAAPGLQKGDFKISLDQNTLKVEVDKPKTESTNKRIKSEFAYTKFTRLFKLSDDVNKEAIGGAYENGILVLTLPKKSDTTTSAKTIQVL